MKTILFIMLLGILSVTSFAGDGADGPDKYEADFKEAGGIYKITSADRRWVQSLVSNLKYKGKIVYFTKSTLKITRNGKVLENAVYQRVGDASSYYIVEGDVMLNIAKGRIYSPGVGGFSAHSPKSRNLIVCLNFNREGVSYTRHSPIKKGKVWWNANKSVNRLDD